MHFYKILAPNSNFYQIRFSVCVCILEKGLTQIQEGPRKGEEMERRKERVSATRWFALIDVDADAVVTEADGFYSESFHVSNVHLQPDLLPNVRIKANT